jgi:hypothetical protein
MQVETYEVQEVADAQVEQCEEARKLAEQLGLEGQQSFYSGSADDRPRAMPYRKMTAQEALVYSTLLPSVTQLKNYSDGPIPLRVLQIAAHAAECLEQHIGTTTLYVWHPANADVKDPLLVACKGSNQYTTERYILARWGTELEEFGILQERAKQVLIAKRQQEIAEAEVKLNAAKAAVESDAAMAVLTGKTKDLTVYYH